jgi:hypothetical protein
MYESDESGMAIPHPWKGLFLFNKPIKNIKGYFFAQKQMPPLFI